MSATLLEASTLIDLSPPPTINRTLATAKVLATCRLTVQIVRTTDPDTEVAVWFVDTRANTGALTSSSRFPTAAEALRYAAKLGAWTNID